MKSFLLKSVLTFALAGSASIATSAVPKQVAGRAPSSWAKDLESKNQTRRLRAARTMAIFGEAAIPQLTTMLAHQDPSIRYWAASHLGDLDKAGATANAQLRKNRGDELFSVRMATAYALSRTDSPKGNLEILIAGLHTPERGTAASAADFLGRIGTAASKAIPELEKTYAKHKDYHVRGAAKNALRFVKNDFTLQNHQRPTGGGPPRSWGAGPKKSGPAARSKSEAAKQPNILWISVEDISPNLGCYGDKYASTPNVDRLARQGVRYTQAFTPAGVCAVVRSGIITGMYPISIGSQHMRSRIVTPPNVKAFSEYLRAAGYFTSNKSKTDYQFEDPLSAWDRVGNKHNDWRDRKPGQPFFSVINITVCHESQIRHGDKTHAALLAKLKPEQRHDPEKAGAFLPPIHPNTPEARKDWARYANVISEMDRQAGEVLQRLEDDGLAENTIVIFWSDHGRGLPRGKRWIYDSGVHIPFIIRWPGVLKPGVNNELVNTEDLTPTTLAIAGVQPKGYMHGRVLVGPKKQPAPKMLHYHRDRMDEAFECMRAARDDRFKYIRNYETRRTYAQHIDYMDMMPTLVALRRLNAEGKLDEKQARFFSPTKPAEELYDIIYDPHETVNLANRKEYQSIVRRMRSATERWQDRIGDKGMMPEPVMMELMRPDHRYAATAPPVIKAVGKKLAISSKTPGASISYKLNNMSNSSWQLYTKPVSLPAGTKLQAKATRIGFQDSAVIDGPTR
jgi:N-sulfoglucosamine sulfohydrolase